jgi:hypothetical protein
MWATHLRATSPFLSARICFAISDVAGTLSTAAMSSLIMLLTVSDLSLIREPGGATPPPADAADPRDCGTDGIIPLIRPQLGTHTSSAAARPPTGADQHLLPAVRSHCDHQWKTDCPGPCDMRAHTHTHTHTQATTRWVWARCVHECCHRANSTSSRTQYLQRVHTDGACLTCFIQPPLVCIRRTLVPLPAPGIPGRRHFFPCSGSADMAFGRAVHDVMCRGMSSVWPEPAALAFAGHVCEACGSSE